MEIKEKENYESEREKRERDRQTTHLPTTDGGKNDQPYLTVKPHNVQNALEKNTS